MTFPTLYHRAKTGKLYQWSISTNDEQIVTAYGVVDGELTTATKLAKPKNVGKTNETSSKEQAISEARAEWTKKLKLRYFQNVEDVDNVVIACMKAPSKKWEETKHHVKYPAHIQPKLDGMRCLAMWEDGRVTLLSRGKEVWDLPHISKELTESLPPDTMLDGELYIHGVNRQTLQKLITQKSTTIEYHVYDVPKYLGKSGQPWEERFLFLHLLTINKWQVQRVHTSKVYSEKEVQDVSNHYVSEGYEGAMVRNLHGVYEWGKRSNNLLKVKPFLDAEYKIIGFKDGVGKNEGLVTWVCETEEGRPFSVEPIGTQEERRELFKNGNQYIGKMLTVRYQTLSNDNIPQITKGIAIRLKKDMDNE